MEGKENVPCRYCKCKDILITETRDKYYTLYYAKCANPECIRHDRYAYVGVRPCDAVAQWNIYNKPIKKERRAK